MNVIIFILTFVVLTDWFQITLFMVNLVRQSKKSKLMDKKILNLVKTKTGLRLKDITVLESDRMFGGMSGIPGKPLMMLSTKLLKELNKDELEYVLLHEAGHFKYFHPLIMVFSQSILILLGLIMAQHSTIINSALFGLIISLFYIQIVRILERQVENFAASRMEKPQSMITAVEKFKNAWSKTSFATVRKYLSWNISYEEKVKIAQKYI